MNSGVDVDPSTIDQAVHGPRGNGSLIRTLMVAAALFCVLDPAAAQTPSYISSLSPFQVRACSGSYAPTNGTSSIQSVTPSQWITGDPCGGLDGVISAWAGGFKAVGGTKLYVHGGGHCDSGNNGIYVFDFSGSAAPVGWSLADISSTSAPNPGSCANMYSDGRGAAVHTYDGAVYAHHNNRMYRFMGSPFCTNGGFTRAGAQYDPATDRWTAISNFPGSTPTFEAATLYDPVTGKILVGVAAGYEVSFFHTGTNTWHSTQQAGSGSAFWSGSCGAWDPTRGRGVLLGKGENRLVSVNWTNETANISVLSPSGSTSVLNDEISCFYDPVRDSYWIFGGGSGSAGYRNLYEMNAATFAVTSNALTGDSIGYMTSPTMVGSYGRFVFLEQWRAIGLVADVDTPAYIVKLPGTSTPTVPLATTLRAE